MRSACSLAPMALEPEPYNYSSGKRSFDEEVTLERPPPSKRIKLCQPQPSLDSLHDDILLSILMALSSSASSPADIISVMMTCKKMKEIIGNPQVLSRVSLPALAVKADRWCIGEHKYLLACASAGNMDACYTLGMIYFYCLGKRALGANLMARAALAAHSAALQSLAIIHFNGSGGRRDDKNLTAGVSLCARSARLGNVDAIRELGHCFQDGYGITKNVLQGRQILLEANAREAAAAVKSTSSRAFLEAALRLRKSHPCSVCPHHGMQFVPSQAPNNQPSDQAVANANENDERLVCGIPCSLLSDFGCDVMPSSPHPANSFLVKWSALHPCPEGLRLCSNSSCGRPETRRHEFRRCSACGQVNYCSRACQALDWKARHKYDCLESAAAAEDQQQYDDAFANDNDDDDDEDDYDGLTVDGEDDGDHRSVLSKEEASLHPES